MTKSASPLQHSLFDMLHQHISTELPIVRCSKSTLAHLSYILEDTILKNKIPAMLFMGFQELSHGYEQTRRYEQFAQIALQVCVFAGKPLPPESYAQQLHIELAEGDPLRQEWFLLILSDSFSVLLCGQDTRQDVSDEEDRQFDTIWTFDQIYITQTLTILEQVIAHYRPERLAQLQDARQTHMLNPPNEMLLSQFLIDVLNHENILEHEFREQSLLLQTVMKQMGLYAYIVEIPNDGKGIIRPVFGDFNALFGYSFEQIKDADYWFDELVYHDDKARFYLTQKMRPLNLIASNDYRYLHRDGHVLWLRVMSQTVSSPSGTIRYGTFMDVTPLYHAQEIEREKQRLAQALEQEKELNAIRTYFMNSVMYEFRNPLASILLASEMLQRYKDKMTEEERDKRLRIIQTQVIQLRDTLDDMALIMNNQISRMGFHPISDHIRRYVNEVINRFRDGRAMYHHLILEDTLSDDPHLIDTRLLKYIIPAILRNAVDYSAQGTTILCRLFREENSIVFSVKDEGIGIPIDDQSHIFKPLFRGKNLPSSHHGGGLGLTVAQECAQLHGGRIEFHSQVGVGSEFRVIIPYVHG